MKRILPLILTVLLLPGLLAVPARADEINTNNWINVLDYGYRVGDTDNRIDLTTERDSNNRVIIQYDLGAVNYVSDIDMIFRTDSDSFTLSKFSSGGGPLTIIHLFDDFYRAVGTFDREYVSGLYVYLFAQTGTYFDIMSFRVSLVPFSQFAKTVHGEIIRGGNDASGRRPIMYPIDPDAGIQNLIVIDNEGNAPMYFQAALEVSEWQGMDYIQLNLSSYCTSIDSINVSLNGYSVPFYINYVNAERSNRLGLTIMDLLIDVRGLDKNFNQALYINVSGTLGADLVGNFAIQDCFGLIQIEQPSLWTYWFTQVGQWFSAQTASLGNTFTSWGQSLKTSFDSGMTALGNTFATWGQSLKTSIDSGISAVRTEIDDFRRTMTAWSKEIHTAITTWGQNIVTALTPDADTSQMEQDVQQAQQDLNNAQDAMNDFTLPAADSVIPDVSGELELGSDSHFGSMMGQFFSDPLIMRMVTTGVAFLLFGIILG